MGEGNRRRGNKALYSVLLKPSVGENQPPLPPAFLLLFLCYQCITDQFTLLIARLDVMEISNDFKFINTDPLHSCTYHRMETNHLLTCTDPWATLGVAPLYSTTFNPLYLQGKVETFQYGIEDPS